MKPLAWMTFVSMISGAAITSAQYSGDGGVYVAPSYHASTIAEGYMRGMGDVVRSRGAANLMNSAAAINYSDARKNELENYKLGTQTYFEAREMNRQYREAERGPRAGKEAWIRFAQIGKPQPLSPSELDSVTGEVNWPMLLKTDSFAQERAELERVFADRAKKGAVSASEFATVDKVTQKMLDDLKDQIRKLPPEQYITAKKFLESLAYEAGQPVG